MSGLDLISDYCENLFYENKDSKKLLVFLPSVNGRGDYPYYPRISWGRELAKKYNIYKHFICNDNIDGNVFHLFCNSYHEIIKKYTYIAMSEADVVLDKDSLHEGIDILNKSNNEVELLSIDLLLDHKKYYHQVLNKLCYHQ